MASSHSHCSASSEPPVPDFKTEFHPHSHRPPLFQHQEDFGLRNTAELAPDGSPWRPFIEEGDYLFAEIALQAGLNSSQVNGLLGLISRISQGKAKFIRHDVTASYNGQENVFPVYGCPLWDWALDLLSNPLLAPHFIWDAQRLYKHNGTKYEQFYTEPWTGDRWWNIQSNLPHIENAVPFAFILYADKTRLSSHGTVKGYPVVARCANLPIDIRNGEQYGGGCVVGWLPIVPEPAENEGKLSYTNFKRVVWHEAFLRILDKLNKFSKTGYCHKCYDEIIRWLFPLILILSGDYEELCMMCLLRGTKSKSPCPMCLIPLEELSDLSKTFELCTSDQAKHVLAIYLRKKSEGEPILKALGLRLVENVFWKVACSDTQDTTSFDRLHALHGGVWGYHLLGEMKILLGKLPRTYAAEIESQLDAFPAWRNLAHFKGILHQVLYAASNVLTNSASRKGYQLMRLICSYLELDSLTGLDAHTERTLEMIEKELLVFGNDLKAGELSEHLKTDWNFPKIHLWKHVVWDIHMKGAACNYSTRPNEKMHGALKNAYQDRSNGKDVAVQILRVDHHRLAMKFIRDRIDAEAERVAEQSAVDGENEDKDGNGQNDVLTSFEGHIKLGAPQPSQSIQDISNTHNSHPEFQNFRQKFTTFINQCLPVYLNHDPNLWAHLSFPETFQVLAGAYVPQDYLRCNPAFHGKPRYDSVVFQVSPEDVAFARLVLMFSCSIPPFGTYDFALVRPLTADIAPSHRPFDEALRLKRVKARPRTASMFIPICSIVRGALLYPDPKHKDEFFVVDHIDGDMLLRMKEWTPLYRH
ncbi:hypothetical protein L210DRAFT_3608318 [Boletus edulis BED1]|uniref:Uncharacterized protein n=1 Tax=Boletus edulis BED1 TaxID=1328754 RepID=A0AAD4GLZ3_BOLED|nr:hypothetical protein L210DRAFT_3608318 [Boletus edulis BED1]